MTTKDYAAHIRALITDDVTHSYDYYGNHGPVNSDQGTGLVIVRNPDGDVVVATTSIGGR